MESHPSYPTRPHYPRRMVVSADGRASVWKRAEVSRHKSLDTLRGYERRVDLFREHTGAAFL
jgi:hypothetical protein